MESTWNPWNGVGIHPFHMEYTGECKDLLKGSMLMVMKGRMLWLTIKRSSFQRKILDQLASWGKDMTEHLPPTGH